MGEGTPSSISRAIPSPRKREREWLCELTFDAFLTWPWSSRGKGTATGESHSRAVGSTFGKALSRVALGST